MEVLGPKLLQALTLISNPPLEFLQGGHRLNNLEQNCSDTLSVS